jgi:hypothetical protein
MRHRKGWFGLLLLTLVGLWANACANQGEGQRCDKNSGDSDCASGLVCTTIQSQTPTGTGGAAAGGLPEAVCCPPQNQSATTTVCSAVSTIFDAGPSTGGGGSAGSDGSVANAGRGGSTQADSGAADLDAGRKDAP